MSLLSKKKFFLIYKSIFLSGILILVQCSSITKSEDTYAALCFAGDIIPHIKIQKFLNENNYNYSHIFSKITNHIENPDYFSANLEFSMSPPFQIKGLLFNSPPGIIKEFKSAGIDILSAANNHIHDNGDEGIKFTINELKKNNFIFTGINNTETLCRKGIIIKNNNIKIGLLSYTSIMNYGFPGKEKPFHINNFNKTSKLYEDIKNIKEKCDYLILQVHIGDEYKLTPYKFDAIRLKRCLEQGADLIIGHHPHVLQYIEQYKTRDNRNCTIFYSIGNFIASHAVDRRIKIKKSNYYIEPYDSVLIKLLLKKEGNRIKDSFRVTPIYIDRTVKNKKLIDIKIISLKNMIIELNSAINSSSNKERIYFLQKKLEKYNYHMKAIEKVLFQKGKFKNIYY